MIILLDSGPLAMIIHPKSAVRNSDCNEWAQLMLTGNHILAIPEIADYEVRRELIRIDSKRGIENLDRISSELYFAPIESRILQKAAEFWATARNRGHPTADKHSLDGDMILCAQAWLLSQKNPDTNVVVATTNTKHISHFADARNWDRIES